MRISDWSSDVCSSDLKQAIERLLRGTNLVARFDDRAVIIRGRSIAATASEQQSSDAIVVTGTRIEGAPPAAPVIRISSEEDRKSTRLNPVPNAHRVCRLLLEKNKHNTKNQIPKPNT